MGLGMPLEERQHAAGLEDSGAGAGSIRPAGLAILGVESGNVLKSGTRALCHSYGESFEEALKASARGGRCGRRAPGGKGR